MKTRNTTPAYEELNVNVLLESKEFMNCVVKIASTFGITKYINDIFNDIKQVCAIAVIECFDLYEAEKVGGNFWGYAYQRMYEYAKNEVANQRETVHLPYNRRNGTCGYEKEQHEYYGIERENDGHEQYKYTSDTYMELEAHECPEGLKMDIAAALNTLNDEQREIVELMHGIKDLKDETKNITYGNVAEELGIHVATLRRKYNDALNTLRAYLA